MTATEGRRPVSLSRPSLVLAVGSTAAVAAAAVSGREFGTPETVGVGPEQFESARPKINDLLDRYVNRGTVEPLRTAQPASDLESLFSDSAVERLKGPERVALVDEGLPKADDVRVEEALAGVVLLGTGPGSGVAVAALRVKVTARVGTTPLTITRSVELTLAAEGDEWKIRGFQVAVSRDTPVGVTTTAAP